MVRDEHVAAQRLLIDWAHHHPDENRWRDVPVEVAQQALAEMLHSGVPADGTNLDAPSDAFVLYVNRLVEEIGGDTVLEAIRLADESELRSHLSRYKLPFQKDLDSRWLDQALRRSTVPDRALRLNAVIGLAFADRMSAAITEALDRPSKSAEVLGIDQLLGGSAPSEAQLVSLLAAAIEQQLGFNGSGPETVDHMLMRVLESVAELTGSDYLTGLAHQLQTCIDRYEYELLDGDLRALAEDDTDWRRFAQLVAELVESREETGLFLPRDVRDSDDPVASVTEALAELLPYLDESLERLRNHTVWSLRAALLLGGTGARLPTLDQMIDSRSEAQPDAILSDLVRLAGPDAIQAQIDEIRARVQDALDAGDPAPPDLAALHELVSGSRNLELAERFSQANPALAMVATVAYAGELTLSGDDTATTAATSPTVVDGPTTPDERSADEDDLAAATPASTDVEEVDATGAADDAGMQEVNADEHRSLNRGGNLREPALEATSSATDAIAEARDDQGGPTAPGGAGEPLREEAEGDSHPPADHRADTSVSAHALVETVSADKAVEAEGTFDGESGEPLRPDSESQVTAEAAEPCAVEVEDTTTRPVSIDESAGPARLSASEESFVVAVSRGRFGAAHHLAALSDQGEANLWRFVALADAVASGTGPIAGAINAIVEDVVHGAEVEGVGGQRGPVLVAYLAAVRAALVAPHTAATSVLAAVARSLPGLDSLTQAIILTSRQGVALIDHVLVQAADLTDAESRVGDAANAVSRWRAEAATRSIKYHRATEVLRILVADNGPIGALCVAACEQYPDERSRRVAADRILGQVTELRDEKAASDAFAAAHAKAFQIHSGALDRLRAYWQEGLDLVAAWAEAVIALDAARAADGDAWQAGFLRKLQDAHAQCSTTLDDLVQSLKADPDARVRANGDAAARLLASVRALLVGERPDQTFELPEAVLNFDLLAVPGCRLAPDWSLIDIANPFEDELLHRLEASVVLPPLDALRAAFEACMACEDHVGTRLCIEALMLLGGEDVDDLAQRDAVAADAAREAITALWRDTEDLLAADARLGYLDETTRRAWIADLYAVNPIGRDDLDVCRATIEGIRSRSSQNRIERTDEIRDEIAAVAAGEPLVHGALDRILARVDAGDLATAWEYVSLAREGTSIPEPPAPLVEVDEFYPDRDRELADQANLRSRAVSAAAGRGEKSGPLDFSQLSSADRAAAKDGLDAWRAMSNVARPGKDYREWASHLPTVLATLGITAESFERSPLTGDKEHDRLWVDLAGVTTTGDPIVPAFAPDPGGRRVMRLLAITGGHDGGQLEAAIDRDRSGDPVVVLHHGPLGPDLRAEIAERFRSLGRAVAVVDDDLFAHLVETGSRRYERTMGLVLPFTTTNPYHLDVSGLVPETMFFGRRAERDAIMDRYGTSHLYGGRQLGKSALLRHVERAFNDTANQVAIYVDLKGAQVGMPRPPQAVFDVLWAPLAQHGIVEGDLPAANVPDAVAAGIDRWLDARPGRRLLVLLDECDNFLKADKDRDLATSARLKDLMERTDRACKFVFAGLHTVQRFSSVANTPMAHLGTPIAIGPLEGAAAADLITKPLHALGYRFSHPELVNRILAHTSRHPALLVIFCHHLLRKLQTRRRLSGEPPFTITEADVDGTWSDPEVSGAIRERVQWTLALDPAYEVITYVIAHLASTEDGGSDHRIPVRDLQAECTYWWPEGFDGYLPEQFRLLADELIGLGVLAKEGSRYGLRNPNVARLLGTSEEIETVLAGAHLKQPEQTFEPATWRRPVQSADGTIFRSPLSHEQLDRLTTPAVTATVVTGTAATGIDRVAESIDAAAGGRTKVTVRTWHDPIEPMLRPVGEDRHRIAVVDLRGAPGSVAAGIVSSVVEAVDPDRPKGGSRGSWAVVLVIDAVRDGAVLRHTLGLPALGTVALQRWSPAAISAFGRDAGFPFAGSDEAAAVAERTGGWGYLVDRVADRVAGATTLAAVLDEADPGQLVSRIGLDADPVAAAAFGVAAGLVIGPDDGCDIETLAAIFDESPAVVEALRVAAARSQLPVATGASVAEQLVLAALLDAGGGHVWVESVAATSVGVG